MSAPHLPTTRPGAIARSLWLARWLLVLVLAWDQIGAPLHAHHHDSGVDGMSTSLVAPGAFLAAAALEDDGERADVFTHASWLVWQQPDLRSLAGRGAAH